MLLLQIPVRLIGESSVCDGFTLSELSEYRGLLQLVLSILHADFSLLDNNIYEVELLVSKPNSGRDSILYKNQLPYRH